MGKSAGHQRNMQCPCSSGKKSKHCCLNEKGKWSKQPKSIQPPGEKTGIPNEKCYMAPFENCSEEMSREHLISQSLLEDLGEFIEVGGQPWTNDQSKIKLPAKEIVSRMLCKRHNEAFSPIDQEAGRFFKILGQLTGKQSEIQQSLFLFNGIDLERWILKTLFGLTSSKVFQRRVEKNFTRKMVTMSPNIEALNLLYDINSWNKGRGLYLSATVAHTLNCFNGIRMTFWTRDLPGLTKFKGIIMNLRGFEFVLSIVPARLNSEQYAYRPRELIFHRENEIVKIIIDWNNPVFNQAIGFQLIEK